MMGIFRQSSEYCQYLSCQAKVAFETFPMLGDIIMANRARGSGLGVNTPVQAIVVWTVQNALLTTVLFEGVQYGHALTNIRFYSFICFYQIR